VNPFSVAHNEDAERCALGSMMLSERATEEVLGMLTAEDFWNPGNRIVFASFKRLHEASKPLDIPIVLQDLRAHDLLDDAGGELAIYQIAEFVSSSGNSAHFAGIVSDLSARRRRETAARKIIERVYDPELSVSQIDLAFERAIEDKPVTAGGDLIRLADVEDVPTRGVASGFGVGFDSLNGLGWPCRHVSIVSAGTGMGKTNFMLQSAYDCVKRGLHVAYMLAADLSPAELRSRLYKMETGWSTCPTVNLEHAAEWELAAKRIRALDNLAIYDWNKHGSEWETMATMLRSVHSKRPFDIVFVDYLQELDTTRKGLHSIEQLTYIMKAMTKFAARLDVPIVTGSQITKREDGSFITKGARTLEEKAALVVRISKEGGQGDVLPGSLYVGKNRQGPQDFTVKAQFTARYLKWEVFSGAVQVEAPKKKTKRADDYDPYNDD